MKHFLKMQLATVVIITFGLGSASAHPIIVTESIASYVRFVDQQKLS